MPDQEGARGQVIGKIKHKDNDYVNSKDFLLKGKGIIMADKGRGLVMEPDLPERAVGFGKIATPTMKGKGRVRA